MEDIKVTYKNNEIEYNEYGNFWGTLEKRFESLELAKKKIDEHIKKENKFERIQVYVENSYANSYPEVTATSITEDNEIWVIDKDGARSKKRSSQVFIINDKNTQIIKEIVDSRKEICLLYKKIEELEKTLETLIKKD